MKVVLDTNVLLAGFATRGLCEAVVAVCMDGHEVFISRHILDELSRNLTTKFKMPAGEARQFVQFVRERATLVEPLPVANDACRDKDDLPVLGTLLAATADCLVTGDPDLLAIKSFQGIAILSPRAFYDRLR